METKDTKDPVFKVPSSSTFEFRAPYPVESSASGAVGGSTLKQRRVSLALPSSSPKVVPEWSFRDDTEIESQKKGKEKERKGDEEEISPTMTVGGAIDGQEKRTRKKWTAEETQMLVQGCNRHGVGNWKTILSDPDLKFDNRSPVDLKDRFRTYFPDAYKKHYPNARTHLSSKVRSTLPDGSSLFEKTRSKKRRPFSEEEDRALKAGYEKHGTVWATIVKDPVFQEQNRKSTDLRDRFRNAFPELYQAAGYKPRKKMGEIHGPVRAATDDQLQLAAGPVRRKRRHTSQGILRGGTKSVPQSATPSEDEYSSGEDEPGRNYRSPSSSRVRSPSRPKRSSSMRSPPATPAMQDEDSMDSLMTMNSLSNVVPFADFMGNSSQSSDFLGPSSSQSDMDAQSQTWSSGLDTPTHSSHQAWSPTSSHLSADYLMSPYERRNESFGGAGMIGKSAWGGDWFSANPRMDNSSNTGFFEPPSSPFSFSSHLNHGVLERYDLVPASIPHDFLSEGGGAVGDNHSTFSDDLFPPSSSFRGFTHHSNYAGDLIFGARTHQPHQSDSMLGLTGMTQAMQILPGIEEIAQTDVPQQPSPPHAQQHPQVQSQSQPPPLTHSHSHPNQHQHQQHQEPESGGLAMDDLVHSTPPGTPPATRPHHLRHRSVDLNHMQYGGQGSGSSLANRSISVPPRESRESSRDVGIGGLSEGGEVRSVYGGSTGAMGLTAASKALFQQQQQQGPPTAVPSQLQHQFFNQDTSQADFFNVPFLDLHYYGVGAMTGGLPGGMAGAGSLGMVDESQRQALDLATTGLKAVCPQDLLLTAQPGDELKRKRASWGAQQ